MQGQAIVSRAPGDQVAPAAPLVRLRYVALFGTALLLVWSGVPRMRAAWALQSAASAFANYALCMVGPTGPALLRDSPSEFRKLVRRGLISAAATDHPFARCARTVREIAPEPVARAHEGAAGAFVEYGLEPGGVAGPALRISDLAVTTRGLAELSDRAWPFVKGGYTSLILPSAFAAEAAHPAELPRPAMARGPLPARPLASGGVWKSEDGLHAFALGTSADRRFHVARSFSPTGVESSAAFAPASAHVVAAASDDSTLVVAWGRAGSSDVALVSCARLGDCTPMTVPELGKGGPRVRAPLDVARVLGVTVVAAPMRGIVRVASTRDGGRTWTPFTVACDSGSAHELAFDVKTPDKLFTVGKRLLLVAPPSSPSATYPALVSDDAGASFRAFTR